MSKSIVEGQKVKYKNEVRTIYGIYVDNQVSLCLIDSDGYEYDDVEEDYCVNVDDIEIMVE